MPGRKLSSNAASACVDAVGGDQQQPLHRAPFAVAATRTAPDGSFGVREVPKTGVRKARTHPPVRRADVTVLGDVGTPLVPI